MEKASTERIIGYLLVLGGITLILLAAFSVYRVFTNNANPISPFNFGPIAVDLSKFVPDAPPGTNMTQNLVQADMINRPMNLFAHLLLMGFLVTVGFRIASLGTMLVRPIKVKLKEKKSN